ncbi:hypothetical protein R5R35_012445 [Gryllus longicercus]|uniref:C2H2-type domain-containing protein n=1 Tax=Gryllus longicercus TaxID=2509291 RepID=A0AAN9VFJ2_9ORTH
MESKYTCIACRVAFKDPEFQRQHYKSDWHRYNLKRKVADFPPVTAEEFQRRVLLQREQDQSTPSASYCAICKKSFNTQNAYNNHLNSKKHKVEVEKSLHKPSHSPRADSTKKSKSNVNEDMDVESDSEVEEVDSDEWEEENEDNPIDDNNCLFCSHHSGTMMKNIKHMTIAHSFFIPDVEYIVDMKGLLTYLGEKVSQYYMCLWCNDRGRTFHSMEAAQQHMIDKGHCKMLHEGEALAEYAAYYDYSSSYPDQAEANPDEEVSIPVLDDTDYELVLPSGARIGHRSLMRYYRQNLDPSKAVVQQKKVHRVMAQYRALGWTETQKEQATRKARDLHYMHRARAKFSQLVGVKANKLQKYFKNQSLCF